MAMSSRTKKSRRGLLRDLLADCTPRVRPLARGVYNLLVKEFAERVESYDGKNFGIGLDAGYKGVVFVITPQADRVNLGFFGGVDLPDPSGLLEGTGKRHRHVKVRTITDVECVALERLIKAAMDARVDGLSRR